jgi:integrase
MPKPLTAVAVAKTKPASTRREIPDGGCRGLYLVIQPKSGARSWALRYRRPDGRPAKLVLGTVFDIADREPDTAPVVGGHHTLAMARRLATALRHEIAQGRDPAADHLAEKRRRNIAATERPTADGLEVIRGGLSDRWADKPLAEINSHDIYSLVDETRRRGAPGLAHRADGPAEGQARHMRSVLSTMFGWLVEHRRLETNPVAGVRRPDTPRSRDRVLTSDEIVKFWRATDAIGQPFGPAAKLLLLTGCRLAEVGRMTRAELSDDGAWSIPASRTKNRRPHLVPFSTTARDILAGMVEGGPYIFSTTGRTPISGWSRAKARLDAAMGVTGWRLHDLRRTFVTHLAELGVRPDVIELAVNHVSGLRGGVAGVYNRSELLPERRAAMQRWADHVAGLVSGKAAKVTPLRRRGA